jgi:hypothetical protein
MARNGLRTHLRNGLLILVATAGVALAPSAAYAKGELLAVEGQAVISGPGLRGSIELQGSVAGSDGEIVSGQSMDDFSAFVNATPLLSFEPGLGWFELAPKDPASLGPIYTVSFRFDYADGATSTARQYLYPYAPGGAMIHIPAGEGLDGRHVDLWWRTNSDFMIRILQARGLPATAPNAAPPAGIAAQQPPAAPTPGPAWTWVVAIGGMFALVLAGAMAARRRQVVGHA